MGRVQLSMAQGRIGEALELASQAHELDPYSLPPHLALVWLYGVGGDYEAARRHYQVALAVDRSELHTHCIMSAVHQHLGNYAEALRAAELGFQTGLAKWGRAPILLAVLAHTTAVCGQRERVLALLAELEEMARQTYVSHFELAMAYSGLGERAKTLEHLRSGLDERSPRITSLNVDPRFAWLRDTPEYQALLARAGLARRAYGSAAD